ncbi:MAG: hypothetical protein QNI91_10690 [Arenicellales bacterium]|nr:hypothetical protein [Arenicellales bacterium]
MSIINGIFLVLVGLGAMGFGLMLFYALLPLFYAFFGLGVGYWFGSLLTSAPEGEMSFIKMVFGLGGAVLFAGGAYFFEPFRRILIGIGLGSLLGGLIASALGLTGFFGVLIMIVGAVIGAGLTLRVFDAFIVVSSSFGGAGMAMDGMHLIFRSLDIFDRTAISDGVAAPLIVWIVVGAIAMGWQFMNIERWSGRAG